MCVLKKSLTEAAPDILLLNIFPQIMCTMELLVLVGLPSEVFEEEDGSLEVDWRQGVEEGNQSLLSGLGL